MVLPEYGTNLEDTLHFFPRRPLGVTLVVNLLEELWGDSLTIVGIRQSLEAVQKFVYIRVFRGSASFRKRNFPSFLPFLGPTPRIPAFSRCLTKSRPRVEGTTETVK